MSEVVERPIGDGIVVNEFGVRVKRHMGWDAYLLKLAEKDQDEFGRELPSDVPMQPPLGYVRQPSMVEHIRNMVRSEHLRLAAEGLGAESFEESDDFDMPDDVEPASIYEVEEVFEPPIPREPAPAVSGASVAGAAPVSGASGAPADPAAPAAPTVHST